MRYQYMRDVYIFFPEPCNNKATVAMSAIARAMKDMKKVAILRCVWRQGQGNVVIGVLTPNISSIDNIADSFYFNVLPFAEDIREFLFPSFSSFRSSLKPSEQQQEAADNLAPSDGEEVLLPDYTPNPVLEMVGCEITRVSAIARHVDMSLPSPDNLCALFTLENGCAGVFVMAVYSSSPKIYWRVDGTKGAIQIERGHDNGRHGYVILFYTLDGRCQRTFYPFSGVTEELQIFLHDISQSTKTEALAGHKPHPCSSYAEGARDVAVLEAMLESSTNNGVQVDFKKF